MLVWRRFGVPLIPICAPLFSIRVPLVSVCVTLSTSSPLRTYFAFTHPFSRYFYKESLMTPPNTLAHFKSLYCYCYPSKNFHRTISFIFHSCSFVFHSCSLVFIRVPFVFTRVHSCSLVFTRAHSCSIRVPFVFTRVHSCSFVFHSCSFVFTRVHSCSFVFTRVHSCSDLCGVLDMILSRWCSCCLLGQFQLKLFYCGKGHQNFASNVTLFPVSVPAKIT